MYYQVILVVHVLLGLGVIGLVLIQQGKGADAGAAFGSASSGSVFGAQGASSFLSRTTAILATLFFTTSLGLAVLSGHQEGNVDLMDAPEIEEVFPDLPLVNGGDTSIDDSLPIVDDGSSGLTGVVESAVSQVQSAVDDTTGILDSTIEDTTDGVVNAVDDSEQFATDVLAPVVDGEQQ